MEITKRHDNINESLKIFIATFSRSFITFKLQQVSAKQHIWTYLQRQFSYGDWVVVLLVFQISNGDLFNPFMHISVVPFFNKFHCSGKFRQNPIFSFTFNPFRPSPRRREKIKLNFYFHTSLWCLKRFYEGLKGLYKTFWGTTKKCELYFTTTFRNAGPGGKG